MTYSVGVPDLDPLDFYPHREFRTLCGTSKYSWAADSAKQTNMRLFPVFSIQWITVGTYSP
jgi:hypothetical protein